jgi:anti-anti-sigma factor
VQARIGYEGDIVLISLIGRLDVETAQPFRTACLNQLHRRKVVFDFGELSFVGSSGILPFLETMQEFAQVNTVGFSFCRVSSEFKKVFSTTSLSQVGIFDTPTEAIESLARSYGHASAPSSLAVISLPINERPKLSPTEGASLANEASKNEAQEIDVMSESPAPYTPMN